jgi:DNA invertase Pin-like site-specific DNA recombinase
MMNTPTSDFWSLKNPEEVLRYIKQLVGDKKPDPRRKRAVLYVRKSRILKDTVHYSPEIQELACRARAEKEGWEIVEVIYDLDKSGRNSKRDGIQRVIRMVKGGQVDYVVAHYLDRSFRNSISFFQFLDLLQKHGADFVSTNEPLDTRTSQGRLMAVMMAMWAELPVTIASERGRAAKAARFQRGLHNGGYRLGYCNGLCSTCTDPNGKGYCPLFGGPDSPESERGRIQVPHPVEQYLVRLIVYSYYQGKSDREIAAEINAHSYELPDGRRVQFRTKGVLNSFPPAKLSRDTVREIVRNPFHVGYVAHYPTAPLSMADNLENPQLIRTQVKDRRVPMELVRGQHEPLYPFEIWQANQQMRRNKKQVPVVDGQPRRVYLLSGTGRCHICYDNDHRNVSLRGSTNGSGEQVYRCAALIDRSILRSKQKAGKSSTSTNPESDKAFQALIEKHDHFALPAGLVEQQVTQLVMRFRIPPEWYERIMAYYLSDDGMSEFERHGYGLRKELDRMKDLYLGGHVSKVEFEKESLRIGKDLEKLQPSSRPDAVFILPMLRNWPSTWEKMNGLERKAVLGVMFDGLYFDRDGTLLNVSIHPPFENTIERLA